MGSRSYVFTLNNPPIFDITQFPPGNGGPIEEAINSLPHFRYASYQYEQGESGTLHYQGYLEFSKPNRLHAVKIGVFARAHFEKRRGSPIDAREYTRKLEGRVAGPWECGKWIGGQGARSDLDEACATLLASRSLREVALSHPASFTKFHPGFAALLEATRDPPKFLEPTWRRWQHETLGLLDQPPDPRKILWFVDPEGAAGKSFLVRYLATNRGALPLSSNKHDRILEAWHGESIVTFDFPRDVQSGDSDRTPYAPIEAIKNGVVYSGFYGKPPRIYEIPHVLCFSNFDPDRTKFSADRWDVRYLDDANGDFEPVPVAGPSSGVQE